MENLNYGMVGNGTTGALISRKGSVDWLCLPRFNSASVFARILDSDRGGVFEILTDPDYEIQQFYIRNTNILVTRFQQGENAFELIDFLPRYHENSHYYCPPDLVRYIRWISGTPEIRVNYDPRLEYAASPTQTTVHPRYIKSFTTRGPYVSVYLYSSFDYEKIVSGTLLRIEEDAYFLMSYNQQLLPQTVDRNYLKYERTKVYWLNWVERTRSFNRFNEEIIRSSLVLKMLSYQKSGAIIAALTTSLPETIGASRNWDYRFCWLRDASMAIKVLMHLGHWNAAERYIQFVIDLLPEKSEKIQIMYGINGEKTLTETTLDHLSGYQNSRPVRVGNDAYRQKQNDIFGVLVDVIYQQFKLFRVTLENSEELWTITRSIIRQVAKNWEKPDRGIWEFRTKLQHFTFSKVLSWVSVDRAVKIARMIGREDYVRMWVVLRDRIRQDIEENAWNEEIGAYTQYYGSGDLDAANLLMESFGFISADDPKYISTVLKTREELSRDGLMYRYRNEDDFGCPKSSFTICTFWLITALYRIGEKKEAEKIFRKVLGYSNHLGLFSEDIDFKTKRLLGNFPQAYSHLALIEAAITLSDEKLAPENQFILTTR